jgi:hypothetical protein
MANRTPATQKSSAGFHPRTTGSCSMWRVLINKTVPAKCQLPPPTKRNKKMQINCCTWYSATEIQRSSRCLKLHRTASTSVEVSLWTERKMRSFKSRTVSCWLITTSCSIQVSLWDHELYACVSVSVYPISTFKPVDLFSRNLRWTFSH